MLRYRLTFAPDDDGSILVTSPDFPPLATFGDDEASARRHAADAITTLIASMMDAHEHIPQSSESVDGPHVVLPLRAALKVELYRKMQEKNLTRAELQRRLGWHRESVDRLFRLDHSSKLEQLEEAFHALGQEVEVKVAAVA